MVKYGPKRFEYLILEGGFQVGIENFIILVSFYPYFCGDLLNIRRIKKKIKHNFLIKNN
jgi:hypothetical protein